MSNVECAHLYERIIDDVIQESRQDFEDSGIDEQTLMDLRNTWRENLSKAGVAKLTWDKQREAEEAREKEAELAEAAVDRGGDHGSGESGFSQQFQLPSFNGSDGTDTGLHLPTTGNEIRSTGEGSTTGSSIILPGGNKLSQVDGPTIEFTMKGSEIPKELRKELRKQLVRNKRKHRIHNIGRQADGANDSTGSEDDSDLGSDLGIDSDEINSDLDDPEDEDDINSDEDNEDPEANIMLCLYDRVQRVRNRWKCNLKDGIANIESKDYAFQKATGDSEW
ncbi:DEKNAAC102903 [Brettanomyces naardenensis]|uniref:Transcription initiation factor IIA large subunit n=1 Tax=Brettanomyces naardenensis TaxID=13370 RepID=A0A448YM36_BRENA|nr:DEKNAAC102903 [Brettanomyces naardenensis]